MNAAKTLAMGLVADLRRRRLLPVAALLAIALVALPIALHQPAESAPSVPAPTGGSAKPAVRADAAPLVSMVALERSSELGAFKPKNPFKPLRQLRGNSPSDVLEGADPFLGAPDPAAAAGGGGGSGSAVDLGADPGGSPDGGTDTGGGGTLPPAGTSPEGGAPGTPQGGDQGSSPTRRFTYAVDATIETPRGKRKRRGLQRLAMLPSEATPLLVFLGVEAGGNDAVFLVDARLTPKGGEGKCSPTDEDCATLRISPGAEHTFTDEEGDEYTIAIDQIRAVPIKARGSRADSARKVASSSTSSEPRRARRFALPQLVDFLVSSD